MAEYSPPRKASGSLNILDTSLSLFLIEEEKLEDKWIPLDLQSCPRQPHWESQEMGIWSRTGWGPGCCLPDAEAPSTSWDTELAASAPAPSSER